MQPDRWQREYPADPLDWLSTGQYHAFMKSGITSGRRQTKQAAASGAFVLRLDSQLHAVLRAAAVAAGTSLNEWCRRTLAAPGAGGLAAAGDVVVPLRERLANQLLGIITYGSFARGELSSNSDIDLLVVLADEVAITRSLYRQWEDVLPAWEGRRVDPHFVHLPAAGDRVSGSWAEASVCGIVLFDSDLIVSRRLIEIRSRIAAGELFRRQAQGQPYWVHEDADAQP